MARQKKDGKRPGVIIYYDWLDALEVMAEQDGTQSVGNVILALLNYAHYGVQPEGLTPTEQMLFSIFRERTDDAAEKYRETCERNARNGQLGGLAKAENARAEQERAAAERVYSPLDFVPSVTRGNTAIMAGNYNRSIDTDDWQVPIPKANGGLFALTRDKAMVYQSQFPSLDMHEQAMAWAECLNAAGEKAWPTNVDIGFEQWCRKALKGN